MDSKLRALLERLGPVRDAVPARSSSAPMVPILLEGCGILDRLVAVARRLHSEGTTLPAAHAAINELAAHGRTVSEIPSDTDFDTLARDLRGWNVAMTRVGEAAVAPASVGASAA